ncbi:MAG: hypothetical protein HS104_36710 [Polyangiaceae bacterium]|nr:hypothetical protein [Polyangiaceae bacterium]MCE7889137.1 hypothetical protein [Sorangiineae bacterium PRO1]MCL4755107.1 hypothetical protein [Myxococcales bacterium]
MKKKQKSARAERRARERARDKLADAREKLWRLEPGGSASRPLDIASASVIEPRTRAEACLRCGAAVRSADHRAETIDERRLRVVTTTCAVCGAARTWYFRLVSELMS